MRKHFRTVSDFINNHSVYFEIAIVLVIFTLALILRLKMIFDIQHPDLVTDAYNYDVMTRQLLDKGFLGYLSTKPNAYITPGYPYFLAIIYAIFGYKDASPILQVRVIQAVIGALSCVVIYLIGRKMKCRSAGYISAAAYALYPTFIWSTTLILTEPLFNFFFLVYLYLQIIVLEKKTAAISFICGVVYIMAVMIRPLIFPLIILPYLLYYLLSKDKAYIKSFAYTVLGMLLLLVPWWLRNIIVLKQFIFLATQTGNPFIAGVLPYYAPQTKEMLDSPNQLMTGIKVIVQGFIHEPLLYLKWFTIGKFNFIFSYAWYYPPEGYTFLKSIWLLHYIIITYGWAGVLAGIWKNSLNKIALLISLIAVALTCLQLLFVPENRYAYTIIALLILAGASSMVDVFSRKREIAIADES